MEGRSATRRKPRLLFVDDEKRVLNSMRAMFRRDYELFLTTRGDEALKIVDQHAIDVVVADQRMPNMSGVQVLSAVRCRSPATVRILLTGYADLDAIEGAMNDGEVFRFLSKPCATDELRGTISQAVTIARETGDDARRVAASEDSANDATDELARLGRRAERPAEREAPARPAVAQRAAPAPSVRRARAQAAATQPDAGARTQTAVAALTAGAATRKAATQPAATTPPDSPAPMPGAPAPAAAATPASRAAVRKAPAPPAAATQRETPAPPRGHVQEPAHDRAVAGPAAVQPATGVSPSDMPQPPVPTLQPPSEIRCVGHGRHNISVLLFTQDGQFARAVGRALSGSLYTFHATSSQQVIDGIANVAPAVLIADLSIDPDEICTLSGVLKQTLPALTTMVASQHRDADVMIDLINHGQVFRFIDKPLSSTACQRHVRAALRRHVQLRRDPQLAQRYAVSARTADGGAWTRLGASVASGLGRLRRLWASEPSAV